MTTYRVVPLSDGVSQRYGWQVKANGRRVSRHELKRAAERAARRKAGQSDSVIVHGLDGRIQR